MKFLVIRDLHGSKPVIPDVGFDAIIVPGDVCSDTGIKPLIMKAVAARKEGKEVSDWWDLVDKDQAKQLLDDSLNAGRAILEQLDSFGVPVYAIPGNWDWTGHGDASWDVLNRNLWEERVVNDHENVIDCDLALVELEGISLIGYGRVNGPEKVELRGYVDVGEVEQEESDEHYQELLDLYSEIFEEAKNDVIFLAHNVPYDTKLDMISDKNNPMDGMHYGSNLVRELAEKYQPLMTIGGHMHEYYGTDIIGDTICLNAGFGSNKATLVEVDSSGVNVSFLNAQSND